MVNGTAKLVVDLGNSSTRVKTYFGVNAKGDSRSRLTVLDNRFGEIQSKLESFLDNELYSEENSRIFHYDDKIYCNGEICNVEFGSSSERPTALNKKYESMITKLTLHNAFCQGYEDIAEFMNCDVDSIDVSWDLTLLLPPDDVDAGAKLLAELAREIKEISFIMPDVKKPINISNVMVYPEGFCALIGTVFESKGKIRKGYSYLLEEDSNTLIVDIGAGTSDMMLAKGCNVISTTRFTREVGGNNVHSRVRRILKGEGISLSDSALRDGCESGLIRVGSKSKSITKEIAQAKADVSRQLVDAIQEFFEDNMIPIQSINNILIVGGGAEHSDVEGIEPIANYVVDFMTKLSKYINVVEIPSISINRGEERVAPRLLNVFGAGVLAE